MAHNQHTTTTVQVQMSGRTILDSIMHKLNSTRKYYRVTLIIPDNGIPIIEYSQANTSKKPKKSIQFVDLLFADKKHDTDEKYAFSIYTTDKTVAFLAKDETTMNEWLSKIRECHSDLYPEFTRYNAIFEANLLDKGLGKTMNIQGPYRVALCKESLDLIPLLTNPHLLSNNNRQQTTSNTTTVTRNPSTNITHHHIETQLPNTTTHHHLPQQLPHHQRFHRRHPELKSKTIELVFRSIRRCGHNKDCKFYIESGRHSHIGEGDLWMALSKKSAARHLHELLLATMKLASTVDDQYVHRPPRSRSGSSSENALRSQQSRSSSLVCLTSESAPSSMVTSATTNNNDNQNYLNNQVTANIISTMPILSTNNNNSDEDSGYLPMA